MCACCETRARNLTELADEFRKKARETHIVHYIELMTRTASDLDALANEARGRCDTPQDTHPCSGCPDTGASANGASQVSP